MLKKFNKTFHKILFALNDNNNLDIINLNISDSTELNMFFNAINIIAEISKNDLWTYDEFVNAVTQQSINRKWMFFILNDKKVGTICFTIYESYIMISCFSIFSEFQGLGLGRKTLDLAVNYIKNTFPNMPIKLRCYEKNIPALNLYKSYGFKYFKKEGKTIFLELF